ncbi:MAG: MarR family winged helix-turn-helix transcriptional regulator [Paenirhodobacter sp.]|uniref:MarR family winged helix-turn-helix transcriptional regulator n=1 Tax=Paenirhodobacter sp. TaxID=1965326 RepID=UPI003D111B5F
MPERETGAEASPGTRAIEHDLALLVRALEGLYRARKHPLDRAQYLLLLALREGPRTSGDLAAALGLDHSTVTRQIAALEKGGLITRRPNPRDRRSALIGASVEGRTRCDEMQGQRLARLEGLLAGWDEAERQRFATDIARFNALLRASKRRG